MAYSADDDKIIKAAVKVGKISGDYVRMWQYAMVADRAGTRRTLAELPAGWMGKDPEHEARVVAAAAGHEPTLRGGGTNPPPAPPARVDDMGFPLPDVPRPILVKKGVNPADYTPQQRSDAGMHALGPRFSANVQPLPARDQYFIPSPNDPYEFDTATGEFRPKPNNRAIPI